MRLSVFFLFFGVAGDLFYKICFLLSLKKYIKNVTLMTFREALGQFSVFQKFCSAEIFLVSAKFLKIKVKLKDRERLSLLRTLKT
jgi:hypothetical protein